MSRAKSVAKAKGVALSRELAELTYDVGYYVHVDSPQDAVKLVTHMPYSGHMLTTEALNAYAGPVVEQSVNQLVQVTPLEQVNERIHDITELVRGHLQDFLTIYGITLNDVMVLIRPTDERMRELISLRAFGLPFNIGLTGLPPAGMPGMPGVPGLGNGAPGSHVPGH